ncbi:MAG: CHAD domain-containing protein [Bacteroidota bacterium]|nr:CHAD domain-containing protein [Bacteroidota bacterium]
MKKQRFRIGSSADTAYELKNTLEIQLLYVSNLFSPSPKDAGKAIHEARQSYKKCRAILRLMRDAMGYASYYRENISLRDMQRELSQIRDADVQYKLFKRLSKRYPEYGSKTWFTRIIEIAKTNYNLEMKRFLKTDKAEDISRYTRLKAAQIQQFELAGEGFEIIEGGLSRIYRQGREMGKTIFSQEADPYEVHAFRKRAKYLQFQLSYLRTISRELFKAMSTTMEELTENLGYYNDLHIACTTIEEIAEENKLTQKKLGILLNGLREEMQNAKSDSRKVYETLYVEKPKHFVKRIRSYWESYTLC